MSDGKIKKILIVEDEKITAQLTSRTVLKHGFDVIHAGDGESALKEINSNHDISLILMDIDLGHGIDGTETARKILETRNLPILFHTSHSEKEMVDRVKGITRYGYVLKDSGEFVLIEAINMAYGLFDAYNLLQNNSLELEATNEELQATIEELEATNEQLIESQNHILAHEKKLEERERHYRSLFESINEGVALHEVIYDDSGKAVDYILVDVNPRYENILNLKKDEVCGKPATEVYNSNPPPFLDTYASVAESGIPDTLEIYYEPFKMFFQISVFSPSNGSFATAFSDITFRKRAEEQLLYFKSAVDLSTNAIGMSTPDGKHFYQNQAFENLFGKIDSENPASQYVDNNLGDTIFKTIMAGERWTGEIEMYGKNREILDIALHAYSIKNSDDEVLCLVGVHTDITVKKKYERELHDSREQYRQYFNQSYDGIFRIDIIPSAPIDMSKEEIVAWINNNAYLIEANSAFSEMYGVPLERMIGRSTNILAPEFAERAVELLYSENHSINRTETFDYDINGNKLWILESFHGEISDGKLRRIWGAQKNITEEKKIEYALRETLKEKNDLLKELQHRVKNSFNLISSIILLEEERQQTTESRQVLNIINRRISSIAELYSMLRDDISTETIQFDEYCKAIIDSLFESYTHSNLSVKIFSELDPTVLTWKQAMPAGLILTEILTNSFKYAFPDNRAGEVSVNLKRIEDNVELLISDNGIGLAPDFDIEKNGGLGLELVSELTTQINGQFRVNDDRGVSFTLTFPVI